MSAPRCIPSPPHSLEAGKPRRGQPTPAPGQLLDVVFPSHHDVDQRSAARAAAGNRTGGPPWAASRSVRLVLAGGGSLARATRPRGEVPT